MKQIQIFTLFFLLAALVSADNFTTLNLKVQTCSFCSDCCFSNGSTLTFSKNQENITFSGSLTGSCTNVINSEETCSLWMYDSSSDVTRYYMSCEQLGQHGTSNSALLKKNSTDGNYYFSWSQQTAQCMVVASSFGTNLALKAVFLLIFIGIMLSN